MNILNELAEALFAGDAATAARCFSPGAAVDDQRLGRLDESGIASWAADMHRWLVQLKATPTTLASLKGAKRQVLELSLDTTTSDGRVDLPYVLVADLQGAHVAELRT